MPSLTVYDDVPYEDRPVTETHVDTLYLAARRAGLTAARPERARVLELGCAHGVNLVPMAFHLPQASFLGVDLSPRQIERGRARVQALGLENLSLRQADVLELELGSRRFDYVIAHGLYSWVPEAVRARVLSLCREILADDGVAYLSYNAMPAWGIRGAIARALLEAVGDATGPADQIRRARAALRTLERVQPLTGTAEGALLRAEIEALRHKPDAYLLHEYLVPENRAFYLREVVERAGRAGLSWVGDVAPSSLSPAETRSARAGLAELGEEPLVVEQLVDIVGFRQFRASLLCRDDAPRGEPMGLGGLTDEVFVAGVPGQTGEDGAGADAEILEVLAERWPRELAVAELAERLSSDEASLVPRLERLVEDRRATLRPRRLPARRAGERPRVAALSRFEAAHLPFVTTPMHETAPVDAFHAALIGHLDGQRTRAELVEALMQDIATGELRLASASLPPKDQLRAAMGRTLESGLERLGLAGLLVA